MQEEGEGAMAGLLMQCTAPMGLACQEGAPCLVATLATEAWTPRLLLQRCSSSALATVMC
jgi:hypothetical protein